MPTEYSKTESLVAKREVTLARRDIPLNKAPGPHSFLAVVYEQCPAFRKVVAKLFTGLLGHDFVLKELRRFHFGPLDNTGIYATLCGKKKPVALLSPVMELAELALVRVMTPLLAWDLPAGQICDGLQKR